MLSRLGHEDDVAVVEGLLAASAAGYGLGRRRLVRLVHGRTASSLTGPPAWIVFYGSMGAYFLTRLYGDAERSGLLHAVSHGVFILVGLCFWTGLVGERSVRRSHLARIGTVLAGMPVEAALGFALMLWPRPLYGQSLAATHGAGQVLLMASMVVSGFAVVVLAVQWVLADTRAEERLARRPPNALTADHRTPSPPGTRPASRSCRGSRGLMSEAPSATG